MIERPRFRASYTVVPAPPDGVFLLSEHGHTLLRGPLHCAIAPLLDGSRSCDDVVDALIGRVPPAEVYFTLDLLEKKGYVVEGDSAAGDLAAFWEIQEVRASEAERRIHDTTVGVRAFGVVSPATLETALRDAGFRTGGESDIEVVLVDDYLDPRLTAVNAEALERGRPWIIAKPNGGVLWTGPFFWPGRGPCWECLAHRIRQNREVELYLEGVRGGAVGPPTAAHPTAESLSAALVVATCTKAIATGPPDQAADDEARDAALLTFVLASMSTKEHVVVQRPQCTVCGSGDAVTPLRPVELEHRIKTFTEDGGHRGATPKETVERYERHVSPITGAVRTLFKTSADEEGMLPVFVAGHNQAVKYGSVDFLREGIRSNAGGKGLTETQARASALCEALERFSGNFQGDEPRLRSSLAALGERAIHPNDCMLFSEAQYQQRDEWNARDSRFERVPVPFDPELEMDWTAVWSVTETEPRYVPTRYCYYGYPNEDRELDCLADSNGNASGNTIEEAILQGFFELVERDGVALWWYPRARRPAVALDSFDDPGIAMLRDRYRRLDRDLWVLDLTTDLGIPTFAAVSPATEGPERIVIGFGSHFDPKIGILRAITEASQSLVVLRSFDDDPTTFDTPTRRWWETATIENQPYLEPSGGDPVRQEFYDAHWSDDFFDDVMRCNEIVARAGMELLVLDQTRPDIGLPVVKVFVPGLRHFWTRFAPGRLYDVPVSLGWVDRRIDESELNPFGMFM